MDKSKAKKAVKKSESRKKESKAAEAMVGMQALLAGMGIDPEIQAPVADMQPPTVNPYHAMGSMAPMMYSAGNMLPGYNYPVMVNPEE